MTSLLQKINELDPTKNDTITSDTDLSCNKINMSGIMSNINNPVFFYRHSYLAPSGIISFIKTGPAPSAATTVPSSDTLTIFTHLYSIDPG